MSEFACDCSCDCGDTPEFYEETYPVAKKRHQCCECREVINPGEKYERVAGKWEGDFLTFKTCMTCVNIRDHYCPHGSIFGELAEQISNCLGFDYREQVDEDDEEDKH